MWHVIARLISSKSELQMRKNENSYINNYDTILEVYIHYKLLIINMINPRIKSMKNIEKKASKIF
jgi:hypothetical protein